LKAIYSGSFRVNWMGTKKRKSDVKRKISEKRC
jgi:hypothetical protein